MSILVFYKVDEIDVLQLNKRHIFKWFYGASGFHTFLKGFQKILEYDFMYFNT